MKLKFLKMKAECTEVRTVLRGFQELPKASKTNQNQSRIRKQAAANGAVMASAFEGFDKIADGTVSFSGCIRKHQLYLQIDMASNDPFLDLSPRKDGPCEKFGADDQKWRAVVVLTASAHPRKGKSERLDDRAAEGETQCFRQNKSRSALNCQATWSGCLA